MLDSQQRVIELLCQFIKSADENVLKKCLQFITGASSIPAFGFDKPITIQFVSEKKFLLLQHVH